MSVLDDLHAALSRQGASREVTDRPAPSTRGTARVADRPDGRKSRGRPMTYRPNTAHPGAIDRATDLVLWRQGESYVVEGRGATVATVCPFTAEQTILARLTRWERSELDARPNFQPSSMVTVRRSEWDELHTPGFAMTGAAGQAEDDAAGIEVPPALPDDLDDLPVLDPEVLEPEPIEKLSGWQRQSRARAKAAKLDDDACVGCEHEGKQTKARNTFAGERLCEGCTFVSQRCLRSGAPRPWHLDSEVAAA